MNKREGIEDTRPDVGGVRLSNVREATAATYPKWSLKGTAAIV